MISAVVNRLASLNKQKTTSALKVRLYESMREESEQTLKRKVA